MKRQLGQHRGAILLGVPAALLVAACIIVGPAVSAARGQSHSTPSSTSPQLLGGVGIGCGPWSTVPSANPSATYAYLSGVAAVPGTNTAWAVGAANVSSEMIQPLVERWDGSSWSVVPTPTVPTVSGAALNGVAAVSAADVWAVGDTSAFVGFGSNPVIEHWDGASWSLVSSPTIPQGGRLQAVTAVSSTDIWAVGTQFPEMGLAEHWDGLSWSVVPMAPPNTFGLLQEMRAVSAASPTDVWAVGFASPVPAGPPSISQIEHWNGLSWSLVPSPNPLPVQNQLYGVVALSAANAWAVGWAGYTGSTGNQVITFIAHWNGMSWSTVSSPNPDPQDNILNGIAAVAGNQLWAVGYTGPPVDPNQGQTLVERWDGTQWRVVPSQNPLPRGAGADILLGVTATPLRTLWAVGYIWKPDVAVDHVIQTLVEHSPPFLGVACRT
jgi:hypothetical protein